MHHNLGLAAVLLADEVAATPSEALQLVFDSLSTRARVQGGSQIASGVLEDSARHELRVPVYLGDVAVVAERGNQAASSAQANRRGAVKAWSNEGPREDAEWPFATILRLSSKELLQSKGATRDRALAGLSVQSAAREAALEASSQQAATFLCAAIALVLPWRAVHEMCLTLRNLLYGLPTPSLSLPAAANTSSAAGQDMQRCMLRAALLTSQGSNSGYDLRTAYLQHLALQSMHWPVSHATFGICARGTAHVYTQLGADVAESVMLQLHTSRCIPQEGQSERGHWPTSATYISSILDGLLAARCWSLAASWAELSGQSKDPIATHRARDVAQSWKQILGRTSISRSCWAVIDEIFVHHSSAPWAVAQFYVSEVENMVSTGQLGADTGLAVLKMARAWLDGSRCGGWPTCPRPLVETLDLAVHLFGFERGMASESETWMPLALLPASYQEPRAAQASADDHLSAFWSMLHVRVKALLSGASPSCVRAAVHTCLEAGNTAVARSLSRLLDSPPIELPLVETALKLIKHGGQLDTGGGAACAPAAVTSFLRRRGASVDTTEELLGSLMNICRPGTGRAVCRWVKAAWEAGQVLGIPAPEVLKLEPIQLVEALVMYQAPLQVIEEFVRSSRIASRELARLLAKLLLKCATSEGLSSERDPSPELLNLIRRLHMGTKTGDSLLKLMLEVNASLTAQTEARVLCLVHRLYVDAWCFSGIDGVIDLTVFKSAEWARRTQPQGLLRLLSGLSQYRFMQKAAKGGGEVYFGWLPPASSSWKATGLWQSLPQGARITRI